MRLYKYNSVSAAIRLLCSAILLGGVRTFFGPCVHDDGSYGNCHYAGEVIAFLALVLVVQSLICLVVEDSKKKTATACMLPVSLLVGAVPGNIIPLCSMSTMRCLAAMRPAVMLLSCIITVVCLVDILILGKDRKE